MKTSRTMPRLRWFRAGAALAAAGAMSGCHLGPNYEAPKTETPSAWDNTSAGTPAAWPQPNWWQAFGSAELNGLMEQARRGNTDLAAAVARMREADAQAQVAGAPLYPSLQLETSTGPERALNLAGKERHHIQYEGLVRASYEIDFWGKNQAALESAEASADASRYARDVVWLTTASSVANTYLQFLSLHDRLRIARQNLEHARSTLDDLMLEEHQGVVPHLAVLQQQAVVSNLAATVPPLGQQLTAASSALAILAGELPENLHLRASSLSELTLPEITVGQPSELLARRPDVRQAEADLMAANADIRVARAQFFPSFSFNLSGGVDALTLAQGTTPLLGVYSLLSNVTQPIFQGGALRGRLDQTKARYQELLAGNYRKAVISAFGDVEVALASVQAARDENTAQQRSAADARQSSSLAQQSLQGGTGTVLELLTTETVEFAAEDALIQAKLAYMDALVALTKALGGGWKQ